MYPISVTLEGIIVELHPCISLLVAVSIIALQPSLESYTLLPSSTIILVREAQPEKASFPISVTLEGITTLVREVQSAKAPTPIYVTLSGITILVREVQS